MNYRKLERNIGLIAFCVATPIAFAALSNLDNPNSIIRASARALSSAGVAGLVTLPVLRFVIDKATEEHIHAYRSKVITVRTTNGFTPVVIRHYVQED